ncbi:MAG: hypothetical protein LAN37_13995 [Acidobacteriia bacterium]|nr:hypothetical protein [Terriglobia bacterium]
MNEFEQKVLADLSELKAHMRWLVGNGTPGLIQQLERRVEEHEKFVQRAGGIGAAVGVILTLIHLTIDYLRATHR